MAMWCSTGVSQEVSALSRRLQRLETKAAIQIKFLFFTNVTLT